MPYIPLEVYANNPSTTVSSGGTSAPAGGTVETWTVASSASFPVVEIGAQQFHVSDPVLPSEIITVTNVSGTTWTVVRGAEASTPVAHAAGFTVVQVVTAGVLASLAYPPWQFSVKAYGAQGDGKIGTGGTGASGQAVLTDAGASFVAGTAPQGDVGKVIIVNQGTGSPTVATNPFCGTIITVNSATSITLSGNLAATCAAAPYVYGTDDAAAITAAVTAAGQWAVATGNSKAQVVFSPAIFMLGALVQSTTYQWPPYNAVNYTYNCHVPLPFATQYARKLTIDLIGTGDAANPDFWGAAIPSLQGTCLVSAVFPPSQPDATFGQMSVVGMPSVNTNIGNGGIAFGNYGNCLVNVEGITVVTPYNGQQYGYDFRNAAQAHVDAAGAIAFAPVNFNAQTCGGPWLRGTNIPANGVAVGLAMPTVGNNDNCHVGRFSCEGISTGLTIGEHFTAQKIDTIYCDTGISVAYTSVVHGACIQYWSCEGCNTVLFTGASGSAKFPLFIGLLDCEVINTFWVNDANSKLYGIIHWYDSTAWSPVGAGTVATSLKILNTRMPPGIWVVDAGTSVPAPPAAPASTVTQQNTTYRDATVYASATTSITNTAVGPLTGSVTALGQTAGAAQAIPVRVPGGFWYSVTYTGTLTTKWVLD